MSSDIVLNPEGTLLDPRPCMTAAVRFATAVLGCPYDGAMVAEASPVTALATALQRSRDDGLVKEAIMLCADHFLDNIGNDAALYRGAAKAVLEAQGRGQRIVALIDHDWQQQALRRFGIRLDDVIPIARNCPFVRQATISALLKKELLSLQAAWITDWPLELALARELGLAARLAGYGRHRSTLKPGLRVSPWRQSPEPATSLQIH